MDGCISSSQFIGVAWLDPLSRGPRGGNHSGLDRLASMHASSHCLPIPRSGCDLDKKRALEWRGQELDSRGNKSKAQGTSSGKASSGYALSRPEAGLPASWGYWIRQASAWLDYGLLCPENHRSKGCERGLSKAPLGLGKADGGIPSPSFLAAAKATLQVLSLSLSTWRRWRGWLGLCPEFRRTVK